MLEGSKAEEGGGCGTGGNCGYHVVCSERVVPWILVVSGREGIVWLRHQRAELRSQRRKGQLDQEGWQVGWQGWQAAKAGRTPHEGMGGERGREGERPSSGLVTWPLASPMKAIIGRGRGSNSLGL